MYIYIYIYIYTHTRTHTRTQYPAGRFTVSERDGARCSQHYMYVLYVSLLYVVTIECIVGGTYISIVSCSKVVFNISNISWAFYFTFGGQAAENNTF